MSQEIKKINLAELVLWTENPRDPISSKADNQVVVNRAIEDADGKWELPKLAHSMGELYDYSELPTVVYLEGKPVVYDGNRRVILALIKHKLVNAPDWTTATPEVEREIPCNVCSEDIALKNIYRKHVLTGNSWNQLERDIFTYKFLGEKKSTFLILDEATDGFITRHPEMNQRFVKEEIFKENVLLDMGFSVANEKLRTRHSAEEVQTLLNDLWLKIRDKKISTRKSRGNPISILDQRSKDIIHDNHDKAWRDCTITTPDQSSVTLPVVPRRSAVTKPLKTSLFGNKLILKPGNVNDLYRDLTSFYEYLEQMPKKFSPKAIAFIRMGLRLLVETSAKDLSLKGADYYVDKYFADAKKTLSADKKTFLSNQNIKAETMPQLLNTGAHNYLLSLSKDQTIAMSIIIGAMLTISHGKK